MQPRLLTRVETIQAQTIALRLTGVWDNGVKLGFALQEGMAVSWSGWTYIYKTGVPVESVLICIELGSSVLEKTTNNAGYWSFLFSFC